MARTSRGLLSDVNNNIDDILTTVNISEDVFANNKSVNLISTNAPINPFNTNAKEFFANYVSGDYEMGWFRDYDHYNTNTGSNFSTEPATFTHVDIGGSNILMNALGYNTRPALISHYPEINSSGDIALTTGSIFSFAYRTATPDNRTTKITTFGVGAAGTIYNGNIDTETISTTVLSFSAAPLNRTFKESNKGVLVYRNSVDGSDTWMRVYNISSAGAVTFENAVEVSTTYNQLFNKGVNVGNNRAVFSSMRGGNDFQLHYVKYNSANNYTKGSVQVTSTQHAGYPTIAYLNDDRVLYIYTRRPSTSGEDRYVIGKLYDTSSFPPTLLTTSTEYDYGSQRLAKMGDSAVGRKSGDTRDAYGVYLTSDTNDNKGLAIPFLASYDTTSTITWNPGTSAPLKCTNASRISTANQAYRSPHHITPIGTNPSDSNEFLYHCIITPNYGWILGQNITTGVLRTVAEGDTNDPNANNTFLRADIHYFGAPGNGSRGLPAGNYEGNRLCMVVAGEYGGAGGDMYLGAAGMVFT